MKEIRQVQAVIVIKGKILLLKKRDVRFENGKWFRTKNSFWRLPKGKLEKGERALAGLKRELREEMGLKKIKIGKRVFSYSYEAPKGLHRKVNSYLVFTDEKPCMTGDGREEGIEKISLETPANALKKLKFDFEKKSLKASWARSVAERCRSRNRVVSLARGVGAR
jgi:ADP-ribose pyrophosphatase YjhB (NUDIX family)